LRVALDTFRFTTATYDVEAIVVADTDEVAEVARDMGGDVLLSTPLTAPQAWNVGAAAARGAWFGLGADDIYFHPGWLEALWPMLETHDGGIIGLNDGATSWQRVGFATHFVASRRFCVEQLGGVFIPPVYGHGMVDVEVCRVAQSRGLFTYCHDALVEHLHPDWGKVATDALYSRDLSSDERLFTAREAAGFPVEWEPVVFPLSVGKAKGKGRTLTRLSTGCQYPDFPY
jgi:glycosyltransferase involved in cell wall biosynthesis